MPFIYRRILFYILGVAGVGFAPYYLYSDFFNEGRTSKPLDKTDTVILPYEPTETDSLDEDLWDETFKVSNLENEKSTGSRSKKITSVSEKEQENTGYSLVNSKRTGCICMDNIQQSMTGRGACSGHGGVRYWLYELKNKTIRKIAANNKEYFIENEYEGEPHGKAQKSENEISHFSFNRNGYIDLLIIMMICITMAFFVKTLFKRK
jgi:hypothetical protein